MENQKDVSESNPGAGQPVFIAYPPYQDDEINLVDICRLVWQGKKIIIGTCVFCMLLAVVTVFFLPKIYKAEIVIMPPLSGDVAGLQVLAAREFNPNQVLHRFMINLNSTGLRYQFFKENRLIEQLSNRVDLEFDDYAAFEAIFNEQINILALNKGNGHKIDIFTNVSLKGENRDVIGKILDKYIYFIDSYTVDSLLDKIDAQLNVRKTVLRERIQELRLTGLKQQDDKIVRLSEALIIAKSLGIAEFQFFLTDDLGQQAGIDQSPELSQSLYARGYKALQEELAQLEKRENNDAFIPGIRELQASLNIFEERKIDSEEIRSVRVDRGVMVTDNPIKPRSELIVVLGGLVGLMLGVFAVFVRRFIAEFTCSGNAANAKAL